MQFRTHTSEWNSQPCTDIAGAADDLHSRDAITDFTNSQFIRIWVGNNRDHLAHYHATEFSSNRRKTFDFQTGHGQLIHQLLCRK